MKSSKLVVHVTQGTIVKKIISSSHYRQKAQHFQAEIARYETPKDAAILLEELAATKQPLLNTTPRMLS